MRRIRTKIFFCLAVLPLLVYVLTVFRSGTAGNFVLIMTTAFGGFGAFFVDLISPILLDLVPLSSEAAVQTFSWMIGYYVSLLLVYLIFSLFTFLITIFMDKIDSIKGGR